MSASVNATLVPGCDAEPNDGAVTYARALADAGGHEMRTENNINDRTSVFAAMYIAPAYSLSVPPLPVPRLAVNLTAAHVRGGFSGDRPRNFDARRHTMFLTPAGQPVTWCKESASRHLVIYFHADVFNGSGEHALAVPALFNATVSGVGQLIDGIADEIQTSGLLSAEAADSLARLLLIQVVRDIQRKSTACHSLTPKVMERLRDFVTAHLGERILVADLAREAGLSPNHFAHSFMKKTGLSPHKFVMDLRVRRAAELLSRSQCGLAQIALDCGFSSQQHMCNVLRRHLDTTPTCIRAQRKAQHIP
jgi:AraC family transcriptional regulator